MNVENLEVWKKSVSLSKAVYMHTAEFPVEERYGLTSQIRRSVVSIASNLAEGAGRETDREFLRFIAIARGSAFELKTQLIIAHEVGFMANLKEDGLFDLIDEITRMLSGLKRSIENRAQSHTSHLTAQSS